MKTRGVMQQSFGHEIAGRPGHSSDGVFAAWHWDGTRLRIRNDRYGFYPLYYFAGPDRVGVARSIPMLLREGAPSDFDETALAVFLRLGFFLGEDTPFRAIRAVPPDTSFEWEDGRLRASRTVLCRPAQHLSRREAINTYIDLFRAAIRRRPPSQNLTVPISGGRDSRHILLALCEAGFRPNKCLTLRHFPPRPNADEESACQLTRALGIPHVVLDAPRSRLHTEMRKNILTNFCSDEHAWYLPAAEYLIRSGSTVYDGIGGDVLSAGLFLTPERLQLLETGRIRDLAESLLTTEEVGLARVLSRADHRRFDRELAIAHVAAELERHGGSPNPIGSFYFWNRTRREIALVPYGLLRELDTVYSPYIDHDLYDFLASLPASMLVDHQFHTETIHTAYPYYKQVPFENKNAPPVLMGAHFRRFALELAAYVSYRSRSARIDKTFLLPRLVRCAMDGDFRKIEWFDPVLIVYLLQLDALRADSTL